MSFIGIDEAIRGATTLKARTGICKNRINGSAPVLPIEENAHLDFDFHKCRSMLAHGTHLHVHTPDGMYTLQHLYYNFLP